MSDLIDRQAAIDALGEKPFAGTGDEYDYEQGLQNQWERDVVAIKILPSAQPETQWIPCSERLPKEKQSVLVTDGFVIWVCDIISTDEGYKWEDSHGYWLDLDEWIAWMKLPELYKEGDGK